MNTEYKLTNLNLRWESHKGMLGKENQQMLKGPTRRHVRSPHRPLTAFACNNTHQCSDEGEALLSREIYWQQVSAPQYTTLNKERTSVLPFSNESPFVLFLSDSAGTCVSMNEGGHVLEKGIVRMQE